METGLDGSVLRKVRLPGQEEGASPILGSWRYCHYTGAIAYERYTSAGSLLFRLPMRPVKGRYALAGNSLTLSRPEHSDTRLTVEARGEDLTVSKSDGQKMEYRRSEFGAWYDLEHAEGCSPGPSAGALTQLGRFVGNWRNADPSSSGIVRLMVVAGKRLTVQIWGSCSPSPCDWGATPVLAYSPPARAGPIESVQALVGTSKSPFSETIILLKPEGNDGLIGEFYTRFTDSSGRKPYAGVYHFHPSVRNGKGALRLASTHETPSLPTLVLALDAVSGSAAAEANVVRFAPNLAVQRPRAGTFAVAHSFASSAGARR